MKIGKRLKIFLSFFVLGVFLLNSTSLDGRELKEIDSIMTSEVVDWSHAPNNEEIHHAIMWLIESHEARLRKAQGPDFGRCFRKAWQWIYTKGIAGYDVRMATSGGHAWCEYYKDDKWIKINDDGEVAITYIEVIFP